MLRLLLLSIVGIIAYCDGFIWKGAALGGSLSLYRRKGKRQSRRLDTAVPIDATCQTASISEQQQQRANELKQQLLQLGMSTERGFRAGRSERQRAKELIFSLASCATVREPARAYYNDAASRSSSAVGNGSDTDALPTLCGQWTLIYTDAPDITSLGNSNPYADLGRIGQDCTSPPLIKNVIEWKRPSWAARLPFAIPGSGNASSRILQKVVTRGSAQPTRPTKVDLAVVGLSVESAKSILREIGNGSDAVVDDDADRSVVDRQDGLVAGLLQGRPFDLSGPWNPPFGSFEVLYLDRDFRITKTSQNYFAVNTRVQPGGEWF